MTRCGLTGVLTEGFETKGMSATDKIYTDEADDIETIPPNAFHRNVDLTVIQADKEGSCIVPCEI